MNPLLTKLLNVAAVAVAFWLMALAARRLWAVPAVRRRLGWAVPPVEWLVLPHRRLPELAHLPPAERDRVWKRVVDDPDNRIGCGVLAIRLLWLLLIPVYLVCTLLLIPFFRDVVRMRRESLTLLWNLEVILGLAAWLWSANMLDVRLLRPLLREYLGGVCPACGSGDRAPADGCPECGTAAAAKGGAA